MAEIVDVHPVEINVQRSSGMQVVWSDGVRSDFQLSDLRRSCPCASCRSEREEAARDRNPLRVLKRSASTEAMTTIRDVQLVGRYALRIAWQDGHDSGIYDYGLLRALGRAGSGEKP